MERKKYSPTEIKKLLEQRGIKNLNHMTVYHRYRRGTMSIEEALTTPTMNASQAGHRGSQFSCWRKK